LIERLSKQSGRKVLSPRETSDDSAFTVLEKVKKGETMRGKKGFRIPSLEIH